MFKKKKFLIGGLIVLLAVSFLGYKAFAGAATYYYRVDEIQTKANTIYGQNVKIEGTIVDGTVERQSAGRILKFVMSDAGGKLTLPVVYTGVVPDTFKAGSDAVVEGKLNTDGTFQATLIMTKCPSKYEPVQSGTTQ